MSNLSSQQTSAASTPHESRALVGMETNRPDGNKLTKGERKYIARLRQDRKERSTELKDNSTEKKEKKIISSKENPAYIRVKPSKISN